MAISGSLPTGTINSPGRSPTSPESAISQSLADLRTRTINIERAQTTIRATSAANALRLDSIPEDAGSIESPTTNITLSNAQMLLNANNTFYYYTEGGHTLTIGSARNSRNEFITSQFYVHVSPSFNGGTQNFTVTSPITIAATGDIFGHTLVRPGDLVLVKSLPNGNILCVLIGNSLGYPSDILHFVDNTLSHTSPISTSRPAPISEVITSTVYFSGQLVLNLSIGAQSIVTNLAINATSHNQQVNIPIYIPGTTIGSVLGTPFKVPSTGDAAPLNNNFTVLDMVVTVAYQRSIVETLNYRVPVRITG